MPWSWSATATSTAWKSFRNLPGVHVITPGELNTYDVLVSDYVVFSSETLPTGGDAEATADAPAPSGDTQTDTDGTEAGS